MKDVVTKAAAFILFESPLDSQLIASNLKFGHDRYKARLPYWPFAASRNKLIVEFWFRQVTPHFLLLALLATIALLPFQKTGSNTIPQLFFSAMLTFFVMALIHYGPIFYGDYLPKLSAVIAEQEKMLTETHETKKCKRSQFSIPALTVIFYVWSKLAQIPVVPVNDNSAVLLNQLFGSDKDKLKQNLSRLYKLSALSPKEKAEIEKGICTARSLFLQLESPHASLLLDELEIKLQKS